MIWKYLSLTFLGFIYKTTYLFGISWYVAVYCIAVAEVSLLCFFFSCQETYTHDRILVLQDVRWGANFQINGLQRHPLNPNRSILLDSTRNKHSLLQHLQQLLVSSWRLVTSKFLSEFPEKSQSDDIGQLKTGLWVVDLFSYKQSWMPIFIFPV